MPKYNDTCPILCARAIRSIRKEQKMLLEWRRAYWRCVSAWNKQEAEAKIAQTHDADCTCKYCESDLDIVEQSQLGRSLSLDDLKFNEQKLLQNVWHWKRYKELLPTLLIDNS